jgi:hypothetical protein
LVIKELKMAARDEEFTMITRQAAAQLWEAWLTLKGLQKEWNAQAYGDNLDLDAGGVNGHLDAVKVGAVIFATADAIETVMLAGNATNVTDLL